MYQLWFEPIANVQLPYAFSYIEDNLLMFSPLSASSILFEDNNRRTEVTTYVVAKAIRSLYIISKRTLNLKVDN